MVPAFTTIQEPDTTGLRVCQSKVHLKIWLDAEVKFLTSVDIFWPFRGKRPKTCSLCA